MNISSEFCFEMHSKCQAKVRGILKDQIEKELGEYFESHTHLTTDLVTLDNLGQLDWYSNGY